MVRLLVTSVLLGVASAREAFVPLRVSLDKLAESKGEVEKALSEVGLIAVDVEGLSSLRSSALAQAAACIASEPHATEAFGDGSKRASLATSVGAGLEPRDVEGCEIESGFRDEVLAATARFGETLGGVYDLEAAGPVLSSAYPTISAVIEHGEHLEHFHVYTSESPSDKETLAMHADQGLFVAFVAPAYLADGDKARFAIELRDGTVADVAIDDETYASSVFFMLGDGVDQFVNEKLAGSGPALRACPHKLLVSSAPRVWYGLMVLAPADAVNPVTGLTYGRLRELAIERPDTAEASMGCSRRLFARELAASSCGENQLFCWARCMDYFDHYGNAVSPDICREQGYSYFNCTDPLLQVSDGTEHGDYYPACTNHQHQTPVPTIAPADEEVCGDAYETRVAEDRAAYSGAMALEYHGRPWDPIVPPLSGGYIFWTLNTDGTISFKQTYPGRLGWMAFGITNPGGGHNGMNGAHIVMGIPGGDYEVAPYRIDDDNSAFRWWSTPLDTTDLAADYSLVEEDCVTSITYTISSFADDLAYSTGDCNNLLWGASTDTQIAYDPTFLNGGYHELRGLVDVDFSSADGACTDDAAPPSDDSSSSKKKKKSSKGSDGILIAIIVVVIVIVIAAFLVGQFVVRKQHKPSTDGVKLEKAVGAKPAEHELLYEESKQTGKAGEPAV